MKSKIKLQTASAGFFVLVFICCFFIIKLVNTPNYYIVQTSKAHDSVQKIPLLFPFDSTVFPPEICAPSFRWEEGNKRIRKWLISISFQDGFSPVNVFSDSSHWIPSETLWQQIKQHSHEQNANISIIGIRNFSSYSLGKISIRTSTDSVGAPLFYREVNLPFNEAVKDPSKIRWRFGSISKNIPPPVVLQNLPVCGNCHSFSANGKVMGMDVDYANDKGSYAIVHVGRSMTLDSSTIMTWSDFKKQDKQKTFGLLSQISPDGNWVISTVKDHSVFVAKPQLDFSQLFFPIKGILALYRPQKKEFTELQGANDPQFVQSNPVWSPNGKTVYFIRSKAFHLDVKNNQVLLTAAECADFLKNGKPFRYDICCVPFNNAKGGAATLLPGASNNGMSNYFPRISPDGKWIVFCKSANFSLLQPDSKLFIMPAGGGEPRLMKCNRSLMNSWHSFSPNGKWMVFSSKGLSIYTQLYLTHIDEKGMDSPPVLLDWMTAKDRAANIPEFVNAADTAISYIRERFVSDVSYMRAAREYITAFDLSSSVLTLYNKALSINPKNSQAHYNLATILTMQNKPDEAAIHFHEAIKLDSSFLMAYCNLATTFAFLGQMDSALVYYQKVISTGKKAGLRQKLLQNCITNTEKENAEALINAHANLALISIKNHSYAPAISEYAKALAIDPNSFDVHCSLADIYLDQNNLPAAKKEYSLALAAKPDFEKALFNLGMVYYKMNELKKAMDLWQKVLTVNPQNAEAAKNLAVMEPKKNN